MLIRQFVAADQDAVIRLWEICDLSRLWNNPEKDIARKVAEQPELFLVGELEGQVIASAMFGYDGHRGSVAYLAVAPTMQRRSFGRQLMRAGEKLLEARGCPKINLLVRNTNLEVLRFYHQLGYADDSVVSVGKRLIRD